jgi:hypothetical protein
VGSGEIENDASEFGKVTGRRSWLAPPVLCHWANGLGTRGCSNTPEQELATLKEQTELLRKQAELMGKQL